MKKYLRLLPYFICLILGLVDCKTPEEPVVSNSTSEYTTLIFSALNGDKQAIVIVDVLTQRNSNRKVGIAKLGRLLLFDTTDTLTLFTELNTIRKDLMAKSPAVSSYKVPSRLLVDRFKKLPSFTQLKILSDDQLNSMFSGKETLVGINAPNPGLLEKIFSLFTTEAYAQINRVDKIVLKLLVGLMIMPSCSLGKDIPNEYWIEAPLALAQVWDIPNPLDCSASMTLIISAAKDLWQGIIMTSILDALNPQNNDSNFDQVASAASNPTSSGGNNQTTSTSSSGGAFGDPHLQTFDGLYYDFQGHGEFIAVKSLTDNFEIQVRQEQIVPYQNHQVTVHTGIAINTGNDIVCVYPNTIFINKQQYGFGNVVVPLTKGNVSYSYGVVTIVTDNEDVIKVIIHPLSPAFLDYKVILNSNRKGKVSGLLGNFDGIPTNDTQLQTGGSINSYTFSDVYPAYADSWRITQDKSLFIYAHGTNTATYTKKDFPKSQPEIDAAARLRAETVCRQQGITEEPYFSACVMDVALSGSDKYAISAVGAEESKLLINNFNINKATSFNEGDLTPHGNVEIADGLMYLTRARAGQSAAVYKKYKLDISNGFETAFDFSMTEPGGIEDAKKRVGADGIVFIIQDYGSKLIPPASGLGLGYDGLPRSVAIEFDTFDDLYYGIKESPDDIWLNTQGISANSADDYRTLIKPQTRPLPVMNDGKVHNVVIRYTKKSEGLYKLEVFFDKDKDSFPYLTADNINIQKMIGAYGTGVYIGLTSSTGAGWENHIIHKWSFKPL